MKYVMVICLLLSNTGLFAANVSGLSASLGSYEPPPGGGFSVTENVFMVIRDPLGRQVGYNPFSDMGFKDIPTSGYGSDTIDDDENGDSGPADFGIQIMELLVPGRYTFEIFGLRDVVYSLEINTDNLNGSGNHFELENYISSGAVSSHVLQLDLAPGAPAPLIFKVVTFDVLRNDVSVAQKLSQLADDKFAASLKKNIDLSEKLAGVCNNRKASKDRCEPAIAVLKLFITRLELVNRKCDNPADCDEEREWSIFRKKHGKDDNYRDFIRDWDRDDWHKHKKQSRRFVTDEALKIIKDDAGWLIKSLGGEMD